MDGGSFHGQTAYTFFDLPTRHKLARGEINHRSRKHIKFDVRLGIIGTVIPVPGAGIVALGASIVAQGPLIYHPMARKLAAIYTASPHELAGMQLDVLPEKIYHNNEIDIASYFTLHFLLMASHEAIAAALGGLWFPIAGGIAGAVVDYYIAKTMTRRIGRMVAFYYLNGSRWKNDSFEDTYQEAKRETKGDISTIIAKNPEIRENMIRKLLSTINIMSKYMSKEKIREMFLDHHVEEELINDAFRMAGI